MSGSAINRANQGSSGFEKESLASLFSIRKQLRDEVSAATGSVNFAEFAEPM